MRKLTLFLFAALASNRISDRNRLLDRLSSVDFGSDIVAEAFATRLGTLFERHIAYPSLPRIPRALDLMRAAVPAEILPARSDRVAPEMAIRA